jgi:nicotinamidase/pyrazinamidase
MAGKLLIVVDFQNDFVSGSLGFLGAEKLEDGICEKIKEYENEEIIYTLDTHDENYLNTQEGRNLPVIHCVKGTIGYELFGKVKELLCDKQCFEKPAFGSGKLYEYLKDKDYKTIELCGLVSNICVLSNAVIAKTACPEAEIIVNSRLTSSSDTQLNEKALDVMRGLQISVKDL